MGLLELLVLTSSFYYSVLAIIAVLVLQGVSRFLWLLIPFLSSLVVIYYFVGSSNV